jgi:hypothetical protein
VQFNRKIEIKVGAVYKNWLVIEEYKVATRNTKRTYMATRYKCRCLLCDVKVCIFTASMLVSDRRTQCKKCSFINRYQYNRQNIGDLSLGCYSRIKLDAASRNLKFNITQKQLWDLFLLQKRKCKLTGVEIKFASRFNSKDKTASLDRIDSSKGYSINNVQWVHRDINQMKWDFPMEQFIDNCILVANFAKKKKK